MENNESDIRSLLELAGRRSSTVVYEGYARDDQNVRDNLLIVESSESIYSFSKSDIREEEEIGASGIAEEGETGERRVRVWVRAGAQAFRTTPFLAGESFSPFTVAMEQVAPPAPPVTLGMPTPAPGAEGAVAMEQVAPPAPPVTLGMPTPAPGAEGAVGAAAPSLPWVGANWANSCAGGDSFGNNCAHFLSDAFIRAGYTELQFYGARCYTWAKRPIRAREMWSWFNSKAVKRSNTVQQNTGWWAVFQLNEQVYWGGHVALLNSNSMLYYGTGWYGNWNQYLYQW